MSKLHDNWYTLLFNDPTIIEELLRSFVHEEFVNDLDFSVIKKINTKYVSPSEKSRQADEVFEIKSKSGHSAYIYIFIEFQSTVDRFMALRMGRYMFESYQEMQSLKKSEYLNPSFPILLYNGDQKWTAPESFSELLIPSSIPKEYLPEFRYFKIAINEIPKRDLVKIRNAIAAVFYVEGSSPKELSKNRQELVSLLASVMKKDGSAIVNVLLDRIHSTLKLPKTSRAIATIEDLIKESGMWEENVKKWEAEVFEKGEKMGVKKGVEQGIKQGGDKKTIEITEKMIDNGMSTADICKITGLPNNKILQIRRRLKKRQE
jgi:predicted transposase/invertase (TIGR01784 family)